MIQVAALPRPRPLTTLVASSMCGVLLVFLCALSGQTLSAQSQAVGFGASYRWLDTRSTLGAFPDIPTCCTLLSPKDGRARSVYGILVRPWSPTVSIEAGLGITSMDINLGAGSFVGYALDVVDGRPTVIQASTYTSVDINAWSTELRLLASWKPFASAPNIHLVSGAALNIMVDAQLRQREVLSTPRSAVFADTRSQERLVFDKTVLDQVDHWPTIHAGVGLHHDLGRVRLTSRLNVEYGLRSLVTSDDGSIGIGRIRFDVQACLLPDDEEQPILPVPPLEIADIPYVGTQLSVNPTTLRETVTIRQTVVPLLPYVFFRHGGSVLDMGKYEILDKQAVRFFDERKMSESLRASLEDPTLPTYYRLLNIVGRRLSEDYPNAVLTISGYVDNQDVEYDARTLALKRAEAIRDYLVDVWNIQKTRLVVQAGVLSPTAASTSMLDELDRRDGHEENRRVEFSSTDPGVLDPVIVRDTLRTVTPEHIPVWFDVRTTDSMESWNLRLSSDQGNGAVRTLFERSDASVPYSPLLVDAGLLVEAAQPSTIVAEMQVETKQLGLRRDTARAPIVYQRTEQLYREQENGFYVERFRLAQFEYDRERPLAVHASTVQRFVIPSIQPDSRVDIDGYTDRKGSESSNLQLSRERATVISTLIPATNMEAINALGEGGPDTPAPYSNQTPEGRLYNRTVQITVRTPIRDGQPGGD